MTEVVVERRSEQPLSHADFVSMSAAASGCLDLHRVLWRGSQLSADGHELICHFSAADLESVRLALKMQGPLRAEIWACAPRDAPGLGASELAQGNVFASWRFDEPPALEQLESIDASNAVCLQNHRVRSLRTFIAQSRRRVIGLYQAADAESLRLALREAKWPVERIWPYRQYLP
jgi:hypothetical protein